MNLLVHFHDLKNTLSSIIAGIITEITAAWLINLYILCFWKTHKLLLFYCRKTLLPAMRAKLSYKSLCDNADYRIGEHISFYPHIHHSVKGSCRTVCMQGRYYQMSGNRGLYRNRGCLAVSNLTNHDNIRVLAKNRSKCCRKGKIHLSIYLNLVDTL